MGDKLRESEGLKSGVGQAPNCTRTSEDHQLVGNPRAFGTRKGKGGSPPVYPEIITKRCVAR